MVSGLVRIDLRETLRWIRSSASWRLGEEKITRCTVNPDRELESLIKPETGGN